MHSIKYEHLIVVKHLTIRSTFLPHSIIYLLNQKAVASYSLHFSLQFRTVQCKQTDPLEYRAKKNFSSNCELHAAPVPLPTAKKQCHETWVQVDATWCWENMSLSTRDKLSSQPIRCKWTDSHCTQRSLHSYPEQHRANSLSKTR